MSLSDELREIADALDDDDTVLNDVAASEAHLSFRIGEDIVEDTEVKIGQTDDPYKDTVMATIFTRDYNEN